MAVAESFSPRCETSVLGLYEKKNLLVGVTEWSPNTK